MEVEAPAPVRGLDRRRPITEMLTVTGRVAMYLDEPGVFRAGNGVIVSDKVARNAGFDVAMHRRIAQVAEKRAELEAELEKFSDEIEVRGDAAAEGIMATQAQALDPETLAHLEPLKWSSPKPGEPKLLRGTKTFHMKHEGGAFFQVIHNETGEEMLLNGKARGDVCVQFMLDWHANEAETETEHVATSADAEPAATAPEDTVPTQ